MNSNKILYITTSLEVGGAEKIVVSLADMAAADNYQVRIICLTGGGALRPSSERISITSLNMRSIFSFFRAYRSVYREINEFNPNVIHSHMYHANILARLVRILIPAPCLVCSAHSSNEGGPIRTLLYRLTNPLCNFFTNVSVEAAKILEAKGAAPRGKIKAIPNGIDTDLFNNHRIKKSEIFTILSVGRLEPPKDYPTLLNAIHRLKSLGVKFKVKIVGDGSALGSLVALSSSLGIEDRIEWLGVRHDVVELMNQADLFVLTSAWEGFGLVVAEAMACELPVVATDCGGVREVMGDDRWLVKVGDFHMLTSKILEVKNLDMTARSELGTNNRLRIVNNYSTKRMYLNYKQLYEAKQLNSTQCS